MKNAIIWLMNENKNSLSRIVKIQGRLIFVKVGRRDQSASHKWNVSIVLNWEPFPAGQTEPALEGWQV